MKKNKKIIVICLFAFILVGICAYCFIFGRGHTIYFDNVTTDDEQHKFYESVKIYYKVSGKTNIFIFHLFSIFLS